MSWAGFFSYLVVIGIAIIALIPSSTAVNCMDSNSSYKEKYNGLYITSIIGLVLQILLIIGATLLFWLMTKEQYFNIVYMLYILTIVIASFALVPISGAINCMDSNTSYKSKFEGLYGTSVVGLVLQILFILGASVLFYISITEKAIILSR